jgi:uncharacterized protein (DUF952 family)/GNAT superfamily N-acetyltransferase
VTAPLLHLATAEAWRADLATGSIAPAPGVGFVHLSDPGQVALPAGRLYAGRRDLVALAVDPTALQRAGVEVRWEPGVATDPSGMRFPHAYGPVPVSAVRAVLPYRPRPDGGFDPLPVPHLDRGTRALLLAHSLLRRTATREVPVTGGVAVLTDPVPASHHHNQLLVDGPTDAARLTADAERVLRGAGRTRSTAWLAGPSAGPTAAELGRQGWTVERLVHLAAPVPAPTPAAVPPAGLLPADRVERLDVEVLRPMRDAVRRRDAPAATAAEVAQLTDRHLLEERVTDLRCLAVRAGGEPVASLLLTIDGGTAMVDAVHTDPAHRGRGHGDALLAAALALAAGAGCDLVVLDAATTTARPRRWYARRGFSEVAESYAVRR